MSENNKEKATNAYIELNKAIITTQQAFSDNQDIYTQGNKIMELPMPTLEPPESVINTNDKITKWANDTKKQVENTINESFLIEMDKLVRLVRDKLGTPHHQPDTPEPRIITLLKGLWLVFKD